MKRPMLFDVSMLALILIVAVIGSVAEHRGGLQALAEGASAAAAEQVRVAHGRLDVRW